MSAADAGPGETVAESPYATEFYTDRRAQTEYAARRVLGIVFDLLAVERIADVGCGTGTWLAAARQLGAEALFGFEGDWLDRALLDDPEIDFAAADLEQALVLPPGLDLVISLEVAEHLSAERASGFVAELCAGAPVVLFSAAIPGQGGVNHLNEAWQSVWARHFAANGFAAYDIVRPMLWTDEGIAFWYRQNTVLYIRDGHVASQGLVPTPPDRLDCVHPRLWERANRELGYANAMPESEYLARQAAGKKG